MTIVFKAQRGQRSLPRCTSDVPRLSHQKSRRQINKDLEKETELKTVQNLVSQTFH